MGLQGSNRGWGREVAVVTEYITVKNQEYTVLDEYFGKAEFKHILLVCGSSYSSLGIKGYLDSLEERFGIKVTFFMEFAPNPVYESIVEGVHKFLDEGCDSILAIGGGSAMDVAKCIKLYSNMDHSLNYLEQEIVPNDIPFIALPTTSGTGSEATRFAVIYYKGEKQSVTDSSCIPGTVIMDASVLNTLPMYQRKATMMDAMCHSIESFWSVNSNEESKEYSRKAISLILQHKDGYLRNEEEANEKMLLASNYAGKAINITQTTAGHAMCYKLTSLYGISHGHAAGLCVKALWPYMLTHTDACTDSRGKEYLNLVFEELGKVFSGTKEEAKDRFTGFFDSLELDVPKLDENKIQILIKSVNPDRLKNHPVKLTEDVIEALYRTILA